KYFEILVSLVVFNDSLMNDAVYKFKRYEDASLSYTGLNRHEGENRGGWDTVISDDDYNSMFALQQASMEVTISSMDHSQETTVVPFEKSVRESDHSELTQQDLIKAAENTPQYKKRTTEIKETPPHSQLTDQCSREQVDVSQVVIGCQVRHKAFGMGKVKEINDGLITVTFGKSNKKFQFPGAFFQGFLSLSE
ncbi:MAG: hypothetical protein Q4C56_10005, partial [Peptococcaceae bacterium]|nr:hypothetical protein [Peptococcaceae bacterium]